MAAWLIFWNQSKQPLVADHVITPQPKPVVVEAPVDESTDLSGENYSYPKLIRVADSGPEGRQKAWESSFAAPINLWGKVVDEKGNPIAGAKVNYKISNSFDPYAKQPEGETSSDEQGLFSILGKSGAGLFVAVSKEGYYQLSSSESGPRSAGTFQFWKKDAPGVKLPTSSDPAVFVLKKKGEPAELVKYEHRRFKLPKDGTPVDISLETGRVAAAGQGDIKVECWVNDQTKTDQKRYDWRCRISVPGGGLSPRAASLDFEAPTEGYQPVEEIRMPPTAERWNDEAGREYFVKLGDNRYARVGLTVYGRSEPYVVLYSFYNPVVGSRNLEYDPTKQVKVK